jgi:transposase-like protein
MQRKTLSAEFKAKVALAALKGDKTINAIAGEHDVHPNQVMTWKKEAQAGLLEIFSGKRGRKSRPSGEMDPETLYSPIGRLKVELWTGLKKSPGSPCSRAAGLDRPGV